MTLQEHERELDLAENKVKNLPDDIPNVLCFIKSNNTEEG
jgi:hypothetical protein